MTETEPEQAQPAEPADESPRVSFDELPLPEVVREGIRAVGFSHCTPIQGKILPLALAGRDVAGQAQTGTGKTAAFLITVFTRLLENATPRRRAAPRALVIAPTRELVVQIAKDAEALNVGTKFHVQAVYGGVDYKKQRDHLSEDVDLLVGTPGRLIDYLRQRVYDLRAIEVLVVDEADRMFDMGFIRDLRFLFRHCPPPDKRQSLLFSATLSHDVLELAYMNMNDAVKVEVKPEQVTAEGVRHVVYHVGVEEKFNVLLGILKREGAERTLVFVNMRRTADRLCQGLELNGYRAEQITGDIDQRKRMRILEEFRDGKLPILVATDVASRGLHIDGVTHVINYDIPLDPEDYVHRVGRTARAGASGDAISLACERYVEGLEPIEKLIGFKLPFEFPDDELAVDAIPLPRRSREREGNRGRERERGAPRSNDRGARSAGARDERAPRRRTPRAAGATATSGPPVEGASPSDASKDPGSQGGLDSPATAAGGASGAGGPEKRRRRRRRSTKTESAAAGDAARASNPSAVATSSDAGERAGGTGEGSDPGASQAPARRRRRRRGRGPRAADPSSPNSSGTAGAGESDGGAA